jgi:hypothetical protein
MGFIGIGDLPSITKWGLSVLVIYQA